MFGIASPSIFFLHLLNFHLVTLEENQECIPKNKREKQCFRKRRCTMQLVFWESMREFAKWRIIANLNSLLVFFFYSPSFLHTAHHTDDLYVWERVSWEKTSIVVVYISVLSCRISDWLRHEFEPITLLNRLKSFDHPAIFRASHSQLEIKNEGVFFITTSIRPINGALKNIMLYYQIFLSVARSL